MALGALSALPDDLSEMTVDVDEFDPPMAPTIIDGVSITPQSDGTIEVDFDPQDSSGLDPISAPFKANLADYIDDNVLDVIARELIEDFETDLESRSDWDKRLAKGIRLMGVVDDNSPGPFQGASRVIHPMLGEAIVQFGARAIAEMWPAKGPVKEKLIGKKSEMKVAQATRVVSYMNYQQTEEMPEAFWELDQMLFRLPLDGSAFKKCWPDSRRGRISTQFIAAAQFVVPYDATSLATASRYTHVLAIQKNDLMKDMRSGFYRQIHLEEPLDEDPTESEDMIDEAEGKERIVGDKSRNNIHNVLEMHVDWDLAGFNEVDSTTGLPTGIGLPYIISIEKDSEKILSIRRNWKEDDPLKAKRIYFIHYKYLPGLGFYGFGLLHMIGGLAKAATGTLRALLDAAQFANMQGGFKSKDAKTEGGQKVIAPGTWIDTDMTSEELSKAFFSIPYKEPSVVLYQLLGFLVDAGQRFASTTESMVGDASNMGPVGTTVALIEQGSKVFSSIHKRLHKAQGEEFRLMASLNFDVLPAGVQYPYEVEGEELFVMKDDFDGRIDVVPVSDPNIFSQTQRIAQAQALLQISTQEGAASLYNQRAVHKRVLTALQIDDIDDILPDKSEVIRMGAVEENMAMLHGKPVRAITSQEHTAHLMVHETWFGSLPDAGQKMLQGVFMAHQAEHYAWQHYFQVQQVMGLRLPPPPDFFEDNPREQRDQEIPPEVERQIDLASANASQIMKNQKPPTEEELKAQAEDKRVMVDAEVRKLDITTRDKRERETAVAKIEADREKQKRGDEAARVKLATEVAMKREELAHAERIERIRQQGSRDAAAIKAKADSASDGAERASDERIAEKDRTSEEGIKDADRKAKSEDVAVQAKASERKSIFGKKKG